MVSEFTDTLRSKAVHTRQANTLEQQLPNLPWFSVWSETPRKWELHVSSSSTAHPALGLPGEEGVAPATAATGHRSSWVVSPELLPKGQQRWLRSPGLLQKEKGEGAVAFSAIIFLPIFIKYKIHSLCSQQSNSTLSSSKVRPSNPPPPEAWWEHHKRVSVLERGQLSYLCTPQPPEALLSAGSLWSSLTSCSMSPSAAGAVLGGKSSLVTDLGTSPATWSGAHSQGHQPCLWGTRGCPAAQSRGVLGVHSSAGGKLGLGGGAGY